MHRRSWPWQLALATGPGNWPWQLALATGPGNWPWQLVLATGLGNWSWQLALATGPGNWPWQLAPATDPVNWPRQRALATGHGTADQPQRLGDRQRAELSCSCTYACGLVDSPRTYSEMPAEMLLADSTSCTILDGKGGKEKTVGSSRGTTKLRGDSCREEAAKRVRLSAPCR